MNILFERCKEYFKSWYITISDICTSLGLDVQPFSKSEEWSKRLTDMFEDTEVVVYITESKYPSIYGYPGRKIMANPWLMKLKHLPDWLLPGVLTIVDKTINMLGFFEKVLNGLYYMNEVNVLIYNPSNNKYRIAPNYMVVYMTTATFDLLNDKEVMAMAVKCVGVSTILFHDCCVEVIERANKLGFWTFYGYLVKVGHDIYTGEETFTDSILSIVKIYTFLMLLSLLIKAMTNYYDRILTVRVDEFPIKCNFGEAYSSAIAKLHEYYMHSMGNNSKDKDKSAKLLARLNILDKILLQYRKIFYAFDQLLAKYGLIDIFTRGERVELVDKRVKLYKDNIKNKLVDRSAIISDEIPLNSPLMKAANAVHNYITK